MATLPFVTMVTTSRFVVNIHVVSMAIYMPLPWQYSWQWHDFLSGYGSDLFTHEVDPDLDPDPDKWCSVNGAYSFMVRA